MDNIQTARKTFGLPIIGELVAIYKLWHEYVPHIAKTSRYTLGGKIDGLLIETAEALFLAAHAPKDQKLPYLRKAATRLDLVKFFLQVSWEVKALDTKKYAVLSERTQEVGRMLGGWTRQVSPKEVQPLEAGLGTAR